MAERLANFPPYQDLVKILRGTALDVDVDEFLAYLTNYMGEYEDYKANFGVAPAVTETEFAVIKSDLPKLVKAFAPILIADAAYTQATYGENYSLYYTYSLASNIKDLVIGHIPESMMPILKSLTTEDEEEWVPGVPNTGREGAGRGDVDSVVSVDYGAAIIVLVLTGGFVWCKGKSKRK
jgi:hypothetical protein